MESIEKRLNEYLFHEFGMDVSGDESQVSETWPFVLRRLAESGTNIVFEFDDDQPYFAFGGDYLSFMPKSGMSVDDLLVQTVGSHWIGARDPVDLAESRPGDASVPSGLERRAALQALGDGALPGREVEILEGLFLRAEARYIGLFRAAGDTESVVAGLADTRIAVLFNEASAWRRLAWGVGHWLATMGEHGAAG